MTCGNLVPQLGIELVPLTVTAGSPIPGNSLSHAYWDRELSGSPILFHPCHHECGWHSQPSSHQPSFSFLINWALFCLEPHCVPGDESYAYKLVLTTLVSFAFPNSPAVKDDLVTASFLTPSFSKRRSSLPLLEYRLDFLTHFKEWLPRLGHKNHCCPALLDDSVWGKLAAMLWEHSTALRRGPCGKN